MKDEEDGPFEGERYSIMGLEGRKQYIIVDNNGMIITFPDNDRKNWQYQATATALARMVSIAMEARVPIDRIKKQLRESSIQLGDTPDILLLALEKYEVKKGIKI